VATFPNLVKEVDTSGVEPIAVILLERLTETRYGALR
jgi:hypothetical protein